MHASMPSLMFESPIGWITISREGDQLARIAIADPVTSRVDAAHGSDDALLAIAQAQLLAYFKDPAFRFDLPLKPSSTRRGEELRSAMAEIPRGEWMSYGALAMRTASSARAIGQVCARNPYPIVIPCHRVLAANGALGHYSAGTGPQTKRWLLAHEGATRWDG